MSDKPLQSDTINFSAIARSHLTQFALAAAKNYKPAAQSPPITETSTTTSTSSTISNSSTTNSTPTVTASNASVVPVASNAGVLTPAASNSNSSSNSTKIEKTAENKTTNDSSKSSGQATEASGGSQNSTHSMNTHTKKSDIVIHTPFQSPMTHEFDSSTSQGCKFVLLDQYVLEVTEDYVSVTGTFQWEACQDQIDRCIEYIRDQCANKRAFLVCSGGLGQHAVPKVHALPQLFAVYVYCGNVMFHKEWAAKYSKVRMVCDNDKRYLIPQLAVDVAQTNLEWAVDILKKGGDKAKAKKKLELALNNVEHHIPQNPQPALLEEIKRRLKECD